jgi:hypothetical protein
MLLHAILIFSLILAYFSLCDSKSSSVTAENMVGFFTIKLGGCGNANPNPGSYKKKGAVIQIEIIYDFPDI